MKYMNLRKKFLPMDLQFFAEGGDGGSDGEDSGDGDDQDDDDSDEDGEDEKKFSQKDIDETVKKRLAREKRKWQRQQSEQEDKSEKGKSRDGGTDDSTRETEADKKAREAEEKAAALEMKWTCLEHDVRKDCVDDVLALAKVHVSKDSSLDIEDAIDKVLEKYPQFKEGYNDQDGEDEDEPESSKKGWGQRHGKPPKKSVTVDDEIRKQLFGK